MLHPAPSPRAFLGSAAALSAWTFLPQGSYGLLKRQPTFNGNPFSLGVASGDPTPTGIVLWTRLARDPLNGGGMGDDAVEVSWIIAHDEKMTKPVKKGTAAATADLAHSVHVEAEGLEPDRVYYYQFKAGNETSPVGRTRTAPAADALRDRLRFAFASCQHYESGLYTAYEHMAKKDLDLVIHLGDYIYEGAAGKSKLRQHIGKEIESLSDYRTRHAQYKTDEHLQAAHAAFPWLVTWDDHEFDNNCAGDISEQPDVDPMQFLARRANAYQAYYEHMPLRRAAKPDGPDMHLYRAINYGGLANFFVLDTRQYRTDQPCGDKNTEPCDMARDPLATMLGAEQKRWLKQGLRKSGSTWNVLAQQVMFAPADRAPGESFAQSMDQWPGYAAERQELLNFFDGSKVKNPVVITGDIHCNWANNLHLGDADTKVVATEFVGTSISSGGNGSARSDYSDAMTRENPFVKFYNAQRGYVECELTPEQWKSDYQIVDYVDKPGAPLKTAATFITENGRPGLQQA